MIAEGLDIRALAVDDERLYWAEYGTLDAFDVHRMDGRVLAVPLAGGAPVVVADGLPGPVGLGVTAGHVYVYVDGFAGASINALLRVPLGGGPPTLVQEDVRLAGAGLGLCRRCFASSGSRAFWYAHERRVFTLTDDATVPEQVASLWVEQLVADAEHLYVLAEASLHRMPLAGGPLEEFERPRVRFLDAAPSTLVGVIQDERSTTHYVAVGLAGAPAWTRIAVLPLDRYGIVRTSGIRYAVYTLTGAGEALLMGNIEERMEPDQRPAEIERDRWVASPPGVYWIEDKRAIRLIPW